MGRKPVFFKESDGSVSARISIPAPIWLLCEELGKYYEIRPDKALRMLMQKLSATLTDRRVSPSSLLLLGADVVAALERVKRSHVGALDITSELDTTKLHRSRKLKSGFVGVYQNGNGFRAEARTAGMGFKHLGTFSTPEEAAWIRFTYYIENQLPYGVWEEAIDALRKQGAVGSDAELIAQIEETNRLVGLEHLNAAPGRPSSPNTEPLTLAETSDRAVEDELEQLAERNAARDAALRARAGKVEP